jgi:hypothetical protein
VLSEQILPDVAAKEKSTGSQSMQGKVHLKDTNCLIMSTAVQYLKVELQLDILAASRRLHHPALKIISTTS